MYIVRYKPILRIKHHPVVEVPVFSSLIASLRIPHEFPYIYTPNVCGPKLDVMSLKIISFMHMLLFCMNSSAT